MAPRKVVCLVMTGLVVTGLLAASGAAANADSSSLRWPAGQPLPHFAAPNHLDVADASSLPADQQLLFNTLEGLVNRTQPRMYLLWASDEGTRTWLDTLRHEFGVPLSRNHNPWTLLRRYRSSVAGMIVYDPAVPDSLNVATSLAGVDRAVVASPALAATLAAAPYHLPLIQDLRGRFTGRLDAYRWAYDHLWAPGAVTHRMLVGLPPFQGPSVHLADVGAVNLPLEPVYDSGALPGEPFPWLRDYAVDAGAMVVWLDHNEPAERSLLEQVLRGMPPDSPYLGAHAGDVAGEITIVALLSSHSVYEVAADFFNNGSVFGGVRPKITKASAGSHRPAFDPKKVYVTFTMSDGDNIQYDQRRLRLLWDNPARGTVPINWTISPLLLDAAPAIFDYFTRGATPNDLLMAGPSGAGYAYPSSWPEKTWRMFTRRTGTAMRAAGITTLDVLNAPNGVRMPLSQPHARDYFRDVKPSGVMLNYNFFPECRTDNAIAGDTPVVTGCIISSSSTAQGETEFDVDQQARRCRALAEQPCFISIEFTAWNVTPADVAAVARTLRQQDPNYAFVTADRYFELVRHAHRAS